MACSIIFLALLPFLSNSNRSIGTSVSIFHKTIIILFVFNCIALTILGAKPAEAPYTSFSIYCTYFYFFSLFLIIFFD